MSDGFIAFVASPPWDTYYRGAIPFFEVNNVGEGLSSVGSSISSVGASIGDELVKSVLNVGVFVGLHKENVISLVMDQDHSETASLDQPVTSSPNSGIIPTNPVSTASATDDVSLLDVASIDSSAIPDIDEKNEKNENKEKQETKANFVISMGSKLKNSALKSLGGVTRNTFPVTTLLYKYTSTQVGNIFKNEEEDDETEVGERGDGGDGGEGDVRQSQLSEGLAYNL